MRRNKIIAILLALMLLTGCGASGDGTISEEGSVVRFTDHTGRAVEVPSKPKTVAVLLSSLADIWITAGGTVDITVGETLERGFVTEAILVDQGAGKTIDLEALIGAEPDFVLYASDIAGQLECADALHAAGIPAAGFALETFQDYLELLKICTDILGAPQNYETYGVNLEAQVNSLIDGARQQSDQPSILFVRAGSTAKVTKAKTAENHFVCVMLKELGTKNIAEAAPVLLDGLSMEEILLADPDVILYTTMGEESAGVTYMQSLLTDPVWQTLTAVQTGQVHQLPKELFQYKPNARWNEAYRYLIDLLYGELL